MSEEFALIEDGMSHTATIPRVAGLHPSVKFRFRPALSDERHGFLIGTDLDGKARAKRICGILKRHLESWDVKLRTGQDVSPKDESILLKLHPTIQAKMLDYVLGYSAIEEAADEKNSVPASSS